MTLASNISPCGPLSPKSGLPAEFRCGTPICTAGSQPWPIFNPARCIRPTLRQALLLGWGGPLLGQEVGFPLKALEWQVMLHFSWAAVGTYLFVRSLLRYLNYRRRQARLGGTVAAIVFVFSGYLSGFPVQQLTILQVSTWLPWILLALTVAARDHPNRAQPANKLVRLLLNLSRAVWAALAFALAILAGHPQTVLYISYLSLAYSLLLTALTRRQKRSLWPPAAWLSMVLLGSALAAAQLLPTLEFIGRSVRAELSYPAVSAGLPLTELVAIIYPGFFGGSPAYVGIATLVLAGLALTIGWTQWRQERQSHQFAFLLFWGGAALVSLLLAFGDNLFLFSLFYLLVPGFEAVRQQERVFLVFAFSAAVLAGFGAALLVGPLSRAAGRALERFSNRLRTVALPAFFVTAVYIYGATAATVRGDDVNLFYGVLWHHLFGLMILAGVIVLLALRSRRRLRRWWGMLLLAGWVAFNLFTVNWRFNLAAPNNVPQFTPNGVTQFLQEQVGVATEQMGRVSSGGLLPGGNSAAAVHQLQDLTGNTPLQLAAVEQFFSSMPSWRLWQLLNVRYVVDQREIGDAGLVPVFAEGDTTVYQMGDPFERAWLVGTVELIADDEQTIARLADDSFDLRKQALVAQPLVDTLSPEADGMVTVQKISPTRIEVLTETSGTQLLVLSQIFYPGWQATVDGQPIDLLQVNGVLQGVTVPAGRHSVVVEFWPRSFQSGVIISVLAVTISIGLLAAGWRWDKPN